jgi:hypothetical protein
MATTKKNYSRSSSVRGNGRFAASGSAPPLGPHDPDERDDRELRFYFSRGPDEKRALKGLTPEQQKTWRRVHRRLDGYGYTLMLYYTKRQADPDPVALCREYRLYVQNAAKSHAVSEWEPHRVVAARRLRSFLKLSAFETITADDGSVIQVHDPVEEDVDVPAYSRTYLGGRGMLGARAMAFLETDTSTWGERRVSVEAARQLLEVAGTLSFAEVKRMEASLVLARFDEELATQQEEQPRIALHVEGDAWEPFRGANPRDWGDPTDHAAPLGAPPRIAQTELKRLSPQARVFYRGDRERAEDEQRQRRVFDRLYGPGSTRSGLNLLAPDIQGQGIAAELRPRAVERDAGRETTTISELSRKYKLPAKWVKDALTRNGFQGPLLKGAQIRIDWLASERGQDFVKAAEREHLARWSHQVRVATRFGGPRRRR